MSNWFERYYAEMMSAQPDYSEASEFVEELRVAAEDFLVECFRDELDLWGAR